jgi:hypothetical protein
MAHFAEIKNGSVQRVIVVANSDCGGGEFPESEPIGQAFIASIGLSGVWKQTSYSASFRNCFAGIGFQYFAEPDKFVPLQPFASWTLDSNHDWQPPTPKPEGNYYWNEEELEWVAI